MLAGAKEVGEADGGLHCSLLPSESLVGLRILIEDPKHESNIVTNPSLKPSDAIHFARRSPKVRLEFGFLKACLWCKRELTPQMDVYMYRGDQGFCSAECRSQQMMLDERREVETSAKVRHRVSHHHRARNKVREVDGSRKISLAA